LDTARRRLGGKIGQRLRDASRWRRLLFVEYRSELRHAQRLAGCKQGGFDDALDQFLVHRFSLTRQSGIPEGWVPAREPASRFGIRSRAVATAGVVLAQP